MSDILATCTPLGSRAVIRRDAADKKVGAIMLPETVQASPKQTGVVIAVGPGKLLADGIREPIDVAVGDRVIISSWAGLEIRDPNVTPENEYILVDIDAIQAKIPA